MKRPNHQAALVPREKIVDYLLSTMHRNGRHKAAFFGRFGFKVDDWQAMAAALHRHAADHDVAKSEDSPFGTRFVVDGITTMPDSRTPIVRTVWFLDNGEAAPRFVTSYYPLSRQSDD